MRNTPYLDNPNIANLNVRFSEEGVELINKSLIIQVQNFAIWFFATILSYLGMQISLGNKELLSGLASHHLDYLSRHIPERSQSRMELCEHLQHLRGKGFINEELSEKIDRVQSATIQTERGHSLQLESTLQRAQAIENLKHQAFVSEAMKRQLATDLRDLSKEAAIHIFDGDELFSLKWRIFMRMQNDFPVYPDISRGQIEEILRNRAPLEIPLILNSEIEPFVKYRELHFLEQKLQEFGLIESYRADIVQAKQQIYQSIPKLALVNRDFRAFFVRSIQNVENYTQSIELYSEFVKRVTEQMVELLDHNPQPKHREILTQYNFFMGVRLYPGYLQALENSGQEVLPQETAVAYERFIRGLLSKEVHSRLCLFCKPSSFHTLFYSSK